MELASACPGGTGSINSTFQPVLYWFWSTTGDSTSQTEAIFCSPTIELFDVTAKSSLNNGSITSVTALDTYTNPTNISGPPLNMSAFNGYSKLSPILGTCDMCLFSFAACFSPLAPISMSSPVLFRYRMRCRALFSGLLLILARFLT